MTVYIVQKLHWEYQDCFYEVDDDSPIKAFVSKHDAQEYRKHLEGEARRQWEVQDARQRAFGRADNQAWTPDGKRVREQEFYQVIAVEYAP